MILTVVWTPFAQDKLAEIWIQAPDRNAVTEAANRISRALRVDPDRKGQALNTGYVLFDPPLAVAFTISADDCIVTVFRVWRVIS